MKRLVVLMVLLIGIAGCSNPDTEEEAEPRVTPVETAPVTKGDFVVDREIVGRATSANTSPVISEVPGEIVSIEVEKGDRVAKGDALAVVDPGTGQNQIELQQIAVRQAEKQLENAQISKQQAAQGVDNAAEQVQLAKQAANAEQSQTSQSVQAARQQYEQAQQLANQTRQLADDGVIPEPLAVQAQNRADQAHAQVQQLQGQAPQSSSAISQAEAQLDQARQQSEQAQVAVEQAELQVEQAQVQLQQAEEQSANRTITAPASGEVSTLNAGTGDLVTNQQPFASIVSLNPMTITAALTPEQLGLFTKGEELDVEVDAISQTIPSTIGYVSSVPDDTGLYPVEARIANENEAVKPGMMATFLLPEIVVENALIVPTDAVVENGNEAYVYHVVDGKAVRVDVTVLEAQTDQMAIEADLPETAEVIKSGQLTLTDGSAVTLMKEDA
ncbi:efflux RND transporter periplasmic adaptor subunit [Halobacillus litoralis]|uniref:efflux RND transporter periplasmic adaptor subunit n=1 Tax=Halobacillus litoralis TaxID=45668 RepID=UPI001CD4A23D|nr:efflux RND transporter periplasmic adaptor subunit [Halobacillus litoralis]MCA0970997.1 efflux RND transporter periplasmic adaptor subunit [Halobacillus litoralis]